MCLPNFMNFCHCPSKILKNQNIVDGWTNGRMDVKIVYPPLTQFAGERGVGYKYVV